MAAREDVGAIFCCRVQSTAKTGAPERARGCDRLPGKGLPWAGAAFCPGAFYAKSASRQRQSSASSYFIDSKKHQHSSTKTAGSSTALATSTGQRTRLDRAHGGTHPAKSWPPERARRGHRLPGKGLPWAGAAFCPRAFYAKSASKHCQASASSYFIDSKKPAQQHQDSRQQHSPGHQHRAAHPAGSSAWRHTPGQELATRTRQARPSLAGQGVALGWRCFSGWGA